MAEVTRSRVAETSTSTGTGDITLAAALDASYKRFADRMSVGDTCEVLVEAHPSDGGAWQRMRATYSAANTLTRGTFVDSSTGSNINFAAGEKVVTMVGAVFVAPAGSLVGTSDAQALTNKELGGGSSATAFAKGTGSGTVTFSGADGLVQTHTANGNVTIAFSNWPASGKFGRMELHLTNYGAYTITGPTATYIQPNGTTTTSLSTYFTALSGASGPSGFQSAGLTIFEYWTTNGGSTVYGRLLC